MNNTKWEELRSEMYELRELSPDWRTRSLKTAYICSWDSCWFYHFRNGEYKDIEWVELRTTSLGQQNLVKDKLQAIHVPGFTYDGGFKIFGYIKEDKPIEYI